MSHTWEANQSVLRPNHSIKSVLLMNQLIWFANLTGHFFHAVTMNEDWRFQVLNRIQKHGKVIQKWSIWIMHYIQSLLIPYNNICDEQTKCKKSVSQLSWQISFHWEFVISVCLALRCSHLQTPGGSKFGLWLWSTAANCYMQ